jgi:putative PIN family toxin of toxin-antitoxin system
LSRSVRRGRPKGVVDTSVLIAGIGGFKGPGVEPTTASGRLLQAWVEEAVFTWLISDEILAEYKEVMQRLGVRRSLIGRIVNLVQEEGSVVYPRRRADLSPDPGDEPFCACAETGRADFIVTLNPRDFLKERLAAKVILPDEPLPSHRHGLRGK